MNTPLPHPHAQKPWAGRRLWLPTAGAALTIAALAVPAAVDHPLLLTLDRATADLLHTRPETPAWETLTRLGGGLLLAVHAVLAAAVLTGTGHWKDALALLTAATTVTACWTLLQLATTRPSPDTPALPSDSGFPAGPATNSTTAAAILTWLARRLRSRPIRIAVLTAAIAYTAAVGATCVTLGLHWPSDIFSGWALALSIVPASLAITRLPLPPDTRSASPPMIRSLRQMFRIITYSIDHIAEGGTPVDQTLARKLKFEGFDHNDVLESHMATYVKYQMRGDRWLELQPQVERHDSGNSHSRSLDIYMRMLGEYHRIMDSRERGLGRFDYLLTFGELQQIADARIHPSNRPRR